jgi:hypothetical protein
MYLNPFWGLLAVFLIGVTTVLFDEEVWFVNSRYNAGTRFQPMLPVFVGFFNKAKTIIKNAK